MLVKSSECAHRGVTTLLTASAVLLVLTSNGSSADWCDGIWKITIENQRGSCNQGRGQKLAGVQNHRISAVSRHGTAFTLSGSVSQCQVVEFTLTTDNGQYASGIGERRNNNWFSGTWAVVKGKDCLGTWNARR
jgi:hypothetical protein